MIDFFVNNARMIIFLHILSAVVWIGGMILMRFALHQSISNISIAKDRLALSLQTMKRFFNIVIFAIILLLFSAILMSIGFNFEDSSLALFIGIKEGIWVVMTLNFGFIYYKRFKAQKLFDNQDYVSTKKELEIIPNILLPINIFLGVIAIYLGVILRGV